MTDEGYWDVHPDATFDHFSTGGSEPLRARSEWIIKDVIEGRTYGLTVLNGVETWWEKVDEFWTLRKREPWWDSK